MELEYIYFEADEGGYIGYFTDFPQHVTEGETLEELEEMLLDMSECLHLTKYHKRAAGYGLNIKTHFGVWDAGLSPKQVHRAFLFIFSNLQCSGLLCFQNASYCKKRYWNEELCSKATEFFVG